MNKKLNKKILANNASWSFDNDVWKNFDNHINNFIPFYLLCHKLGLEISDFFLEKNSRVIDLGSWTGTIINKLHKRHHNKHLQIRDYEVIKKMIQMAKKNNRNRKNIKFFQKDIVEIKLPDNIDLITSFFTISFIKPSFRQVIFNKILN